MYLAIIIFFCFNFYIFSYVAKILVNFQKNILIYLAMSCLNTFLMVFAYYLKTPYYLSYFWVLITLTIEFLVFSKAKFTQAFLYASIIVVHISASQMLFIPIYSLILGVTPYELFNTPNLFYSSISTLFIILHIVLTVWLKVVSNKDIIKLSTTPIYSLMVSAIDTFIIFYTIIDVITLQSTQYSSEYLVTFITVPILTFVLFYILFFYSIKSVNIVAFKRKSDQLELAKIQSNIHKKSIEDKVLKDDLTSCYNRKYIISNLREKHRDNIFNFAILFADIDGLKMVNDTLGHEFGDEYIINVSKVIKQAIREYDLVARIGGDEFLIILNDIEERDIKSILDRINEKINILDKKTKEYKVSASIGYIFVDEELLKTGVDNIIKIADDKMRIQKKSSKGE